MLSLKQGQLEMSRIKKPPGKWRKHTSLADVKTESEDSVMQSQNKPSQITEPPKVPLPTTESTSYAGISRTSAQKCLELILGFIFLWILGLKLALIFTVLGGISGIIALFKG